MPSEPVNLEAYQYATESDDFDGSHLPVPTHCLSQLKQLDQLNFKVLAALGSPGSSGSGSLGPVVQCILTSDINNSAAPIN